MSGRWGVAALGQNPDLSTPKRGPRFIGSVFLGSSQHPASAHCVRGAFASYCPPAGLRTAVSLAWGPGQGDQGRPAPAPCRPASFPSAPPTHSTTRKSRPQIDLPLRAPEPRDSRATDPRPTQLTAEPPLTSLAAEPRPTNSCACAPRRRPAPPPSRYACAEGASSFLF